MEKKEEKNAWNSEISFFSVEVHSFWESEILKNEIFSLLHLESR